MLARISTVLCLIATPVLLTGCFGGGSDVDRNTQFDQFIIDIPEGYQEVPTTLVENKQILNKVIKSFKLSDDEGYADNILITKSLIAPSVTSKQFASANREKLNSDIIGLVPGEQSLDTFDCGDAEITAYRSAFQVNETFYENASRYFVEQYQFVANEQGYLLSFATDQDAKQANRVMKKLIKSLKCS